MFERPFAVLKRIRNKERGIILLSCLKDVVFMHRLINIAHFLGTKGFNSPATTKERLDFYITGERQEIEHLLNDILVYFRIKAEKILKLEKKRDGDRITYLIYL